MGKRILNDQLIKRFRDHLIEREMSGATVEKYCRDVTAFTRFANGDAVCKTLVISYKNKLKDDGYAVRSINSMIAGINSLFSFLRWYDCRVKPLRLQREIFCPEEKELSKNEFQRLVNTATAKNNERLCLILQTIGGTGIRISELEFITVEAVKKGEATVSCK